MAVVQFSIPADAYVVAVERATRLGISEHQLLKTLALMSFSSISDDAVLEYRRNMMKVKADKKYHKLRGIV